MNSSYPQKHGESHDYNVEEKRLTQKNRHDVTPLRRRENTNTSKQDSKSG